MGERPAIARILVSGPFNSGKTTFINTLCAGKIFSTDRGVTNPAERRVKPTTTIALDFGITMIDNVRVYLYGSPGQARLARVMLPALVRRCDYLVFLVDTTSVASLYRARTFFETFLRGRLHAFKSYVICANKRDISTIPLERVREVFDGYPMMELVALRRSSCERVLRELLGLPARAEDEGER